MSASSRVFAFLAYLLLIVGWLLVVIFRRRDAFAAFHARQALRMTIYLIVVPAIWAAAAYMIAFVPYLGPLTASASFTLVIIFLLAFLLAWIMGMINALRAKETPALFFGSR